MLLMLSNLEYKVHSSLMDASHMRCSMRFWQEEKMAWVVVEVAP